MQFNRGLGQMNMLWLRSWSPETMSKYMPWTLPIRVVSFITKMLLKSLSCCFRNLLHALWCYFTAYKKSLEEAIHSDTSGHFCRILVSLVQVIFIITRACSGVFKFHAHSVVAVCLLRKKCLLHSSPVFFHDVLHYLWNKTQNIFLVIATFNLVLSALCRVQEKRALQMWKEQTQMLRWFSEPLIVSCNILLC